MVEEGVSISGLRLLVLPKKKGIPPKLAKNMLTGKMVINHIILVYRCLQITQVGHYSHGSANTMRNHEIGAFVTIN